jgi:hypothetical protein
MDRFRGLAEMVLFCIAPAVVLGLPSAFVLGWWGARCARHTGEGTQDSGVL